MAVKGGMRFDWLVCEEKCVLNSFVFCLEESSSSGNGSFSLIILSSQKFKNNMKFKKDTNGHGLMVKHLPCEYEV